MNSPARILLAACTLCLATPAAAADLACSARSGARTAALVELYTSEGCSSCPPADRQLRTLRQQLQDGAELVPLALHVTYWDQIGWKDPFAQAAFDVRQGELVAAKGSRLVYTPQFFVNGAELRSWRDGLAGAIRQANARPAPVSITLSSRPLADDAMLLEAEVMPGEGREAVPGELYVALSESGLVSQVLRGENSGATLHHDHTVRAWFGPLPLRQGMARFRQEIRLPPGWDRRHLQAVAFVQGGRAGPVLQAVSARGCGPGA